MGNARQGKDHGDDSAPFGSSAAHNSQRFLITPDETADHVTSIFANAVIPELFDSGAQCGLSDATIERFANLLVRSDCQPSSDDIAALSSCGVDFQGLCLHLLTPAARRLGELWERDDCDFIDVTMGVWRLQEVMRAASRNCQTQQRPQSLRSRSLFAPLPGDDHQFGALMMDEVFAAAGWDSEAIAKPRRRELLNRLSEKRFDLVGLTVTRDTPSIALTNIVRAIRAASANPDIVVLFGGRMINANPAIVEQVGGDGTAVDAKSALEAAERLVDAVRWTIRTER